MPLGLRQKGEVLCLKKTLYGLRQSPRMFWKYLTNAMKACGMEASGFDPCMFIGERAVAVAFVDDILLWATDEKYINNDLGAQLHDQGLLLEEEGDEAGFLGVTMTRDDKGAIELKQTGLIGRSSEALGLDTKHATGKYTPAEISPLTKAEDGPGPEGYFNYASVVGTMLYLSGHSCPGIAGRHVVGPGRSGRQRGRGKAAS